MTFPWNLQEVFRSAPVQHRFRWPLWLSHLEEALEMLLLAISRAFLQAVPLQLSNQQPFTPDTEPQQAVSAFLELALDEEPLSPDLERLLSSFLASFTIGIWAGTDLKITVKVKLLVELRTSIQASCNGLRAAILGEGWEFVQVCMGPAYPDGVCCAWRWDIRLLSALDIYISRPLSLRSHWTSLHDWPWGHNVWRHCGKWFLLVLLTVCYVSVFKEEAKGTSEVPRLPTFPSTAST